MFTGGKIEFDGGQTKVLMWYIEFDRKNEKKIPPQLHVQIHLKVVHLIHQRYDFVSEVSKIVTKKRSSFLYK